jgi:hypothetical protein
MFGGALNLNVHFHTLARDGVFIEADVVPARFEPLEAPSDEDVGGHPGPGRTPGDEGAAEVRGRPRPRRGRAGRPPGGGGRSAAPGSRILRASASQRVPGRVLPARRRPGARQRPAGKGAALQVHPPATAGASPAVTLDGRRPRLPDEAATARLGCSQSSIWTSSPTRSRRWRGRSALRIRSRRHRRPGSRRRHAQTLRRHDQVIDAQ